MSLALAPPSAAKSTRVSISNYAWSSPVVRIDLGEKVTWDWIGPDLAHSVTGVSPNALLWDSDPHTDAPRHLPGDSYTIQFAQPGVYQFRCKLHAAVRGEVVVSSAPGDPDSDPGPQAPLLLDTKPPTLGGVAVKPPRFRTRRGVSLTAQVSEPGRLDAEYHRIGPKGRRLYSGYKVWKVFLGINHLRFAARWRHFKARPGRYVAVLRATDRAANTSKPVTKGFTILPRRENRRPPPRQRLR